MKNKFNRTGLVLTGAAVLLVGLAGNIQAVPVATSSARAYETARSRELSLEVESTARRAEALLAQLPTLHETVTAHGLQPSLARTGGSVVPARQPVLVHGNPSGLALFTSFPVDVPSHTGIIQGETIYHIPTAVITRPVIDRPTATASPAVTSVPDGGTTAGLLSAALCGVVLLRRKLAA